MPRKINFSLASDHPTLDRLMSRTETSPSLIAKRDIERYYRLLEATPMPTFTKREALAIVKALNGVRIDTEILPSAVIYNIMGELELDADGVAFIDRVKSFSSADLFKILDAAEIFWNSDKYHIEDTDLRLQQAGFTVSMSSPGKNR